MLTVTSTLHMTPLGRLVAGGLAKGCDAAVDAWATYTADQARSHAHQITGAMAMATGVVTPLQDDYTPRVHAAAVLNPQGATLPTPVRPPGHSAVVAAGMAYSAYEEYGTSRRGPHPWFVVGTEAGRQNAAQVTAPHLKRALEHP